MGERTNESAFESIVEAHLLQNRHLPISRECFYREHVISAEAVLALIGETQPKEWVKIQSLYGERTGEQILGRLCEWIDQYGALATLRHGFKRYGRTLDAASFKAEAEHELNPDLEARYAANCLGLLTRQLHFSSRSEKSLGRIAPRCPVWHFEQKLAKMT